VVTASPFSPTYQYVTTNGGLTGAGEISSVGGTNGSSLTTTPFAVTAGSQLQFYFNYVTSDGAGYADYSWAELQTALGAHVAWLFTARTEASGNTSPGVGLPANDSTLMPPTSAIIPGGPVFSPLGSYSGLCFSAGCGYTGWIGSQYTIAAAGAYQIEFGVTNWADTLYDSALAFNGETINGVPISGTPEPSAFLLFGTVVGALALVRRRRQA
jgi:hypothetical protein